MANLEAEPREGRPSPKSFLLEAERENRGRFKLFIGAAPGVGKTYEMLRVGRAKQAEGIDAVIGVVETHGRAETAALVQAFETIPRRKLNYKGRDTEEMDLDAILARHPQLVLVDELAHTNAEGSRHPKRYLDVQELLAAGIDIYSTMNVQHLESLNDVVAKITRIRVRETVPDNILELADEIEVVDLTPEALIERLNEGKVYVRDQAQRALKHYFSLGNLTALRELALRATAQRVDNQMLQYMQSHAIEGPWGASEQVLVCVSEDPRSVELLRYASRMAERLKAKWTALYIESLRHSLLSEAQRDTIAETMRMAERLGGEAITIPGERVADDVLVYAKANNFTHIVIGKSERSRWFEMMHGSIVYDLVRRSETISVHVIAGEPDAPKAKRTSLETQAAPIAVRPSAYVVSALMVGIAVGISYLIARVVALPNLSLVFLTAVLFSALRYGLWPSIMASLLSVASYNFFFVPPLYTFTIADPANVLALVFFLIAALVVSNLTAQKQRQTQSMAARAKTTAELYAFSRKVAGIGSLDDLMWVVTYQIAAMLTCDVVVLLPGPDGLQVRAGYPPEDSLDAADMAAAEWTWTSNHAAGRGSDTLPGGKRLFLPIQTQRGAIGVVGINRERPTLLSPDERRLLDALLDQAAVAIERVRLAEDVDQVRLQAETERLRNALLTSVSHDLRTPLATIIGALTSLKSFGETYDAQTRLELVSSAQDEAERLNRFVGNLLDMTRLESGGISVKLESIDLGDAIGVALNRARPMLVHHTTEVELAADLPMVKADFVLLEQVIFNLLDNAAKYTPPGTTIRISGQVDGDAIEIAVIDQGEGIPPQSLEAVFNKFTRLQAGDRKGAGTGLGLPICRGFVEAMGGTIFAGNRQDRSGAIFTIRLEKAPAYSGSQTQAEAHVP
ncbi:MAG: osmosensitive channel signal transduction histidine kinase [Rhodospirillales bacterium]|nr:osmosensitive channel signal transduction histidine kinase [Rhodospirillales bacterium]